MSGKLVLFGLLTSAGLILAEEGRPISNQVMQRLVRKAMAATGIRASGYVVVPYTDKSSSDFYSFQAFLQNSTSDGDIGFFAINRWTGEVWSVGSCSQVRSTDLSKEQTSILKHSGVKPSTAVKHNQRPPECPPDTESK